MMALTPGGGRSPSTRPPPAPTPTGQPRQTRDSRQPRTPSQIASFSVVRWGLLLGGLVIIVDLATQVLLQRTPSPQEVNTIGAADEIVNFVLFSILGILVVRDSGLMYLGAIAGVFASLLDALVVAAATSMAPPAGQLASIEDVFLSNLALGTVFAGVGGFAYAILQRWSGGRRQK